MPMSIVIIHTSNNSMYPLPNDNDSNSNDNDSLSTSNSNNHSNTYCYRETNLGLQIPSTVGRRAVIRWRT